MRVLIAEDLALLRDGLSRLLRQCLLLRNSFGLCLLGFCFLPGCFGSGCLSFGLHTLGFGSCSFGLLLSIFGLSAALGFGLRVGTGFGFAIFCGLLLSGDPGIGLVFRLLLHRHDACFFRGLRGFTGGGIYCGFALLVAISLLGRSQLLISLRQD